MGAPLDPRPIGRLVGEAVQAAIASRKRPPVAARLARIRDAKAARDASLRGPIALGAALGAVVAAAILWPRAEPLRFSIGGPEQDSLAGAWIAAPPGAEIPIGFSDGTRILLEGGARARVVAVSDHGARILVERGALRADVVPRRGNDWSVIGGPFEIHVTGTSFDAAWDPEHEALRVAVRHGSVIVHGPCLAQGRALGGGEEATLSCAPGAASEAPAPPEAIGAPAPVPAASVEAAARAPGVARPSAPAPSASVEAPPSWRDLGRAGAYKEAIAAAEAEGFDRLCDELPAADLMDLAATARLGGKTARASEAYTAVRRRFPGSEQAATAAFRLGQLAFDGARAFAEARRWFLAYLAERPGGALAAEALGRTMEAEQRLGDLAAARAHAAEYVARYPGGAHAALANSLLAP